MLASTSPGAMPPSTTYDVGVRPPGGGVQRSVTVFPATLSTASVTGGKGSAPPQAAGRLKPLTGDVLDGPLLIASMPSPNAANEVHRRQTSSPPCRLCAAWMMPSRACVKVGLHAVFFRPSVT